MCDVETVSEAMERRRLDEKNDRIAKLESLLLECRASIDGDCRLFKRSSGNARLLKAIDDATKG